ncbi:MAG: diguanylate cyclase [Thermoanaerobaculaceae bacterium]
MQQSPPRSSPRLLPVEDRLPLRGLDLERLVNLIRIFGISGVGLVAAFVQSRGKAPPPEIAGLSPLVGIILGLTLLQIGLAFSPWKPKYRYPLAFLDVTLVTAVLFWFVATGRPLVATNSEVVFFGYLLAQVLASLRGERKLSNDVALAAPLAYGGVLFIAVTFGEAPSLPPDPVYGPFRWDLQVLRLLLLFICWVAVMYASKLAENEHRASRLDPLTGVFNRRFLDELLTMVVARARRSRQPLSILMVDLDGFKQYNDQSGHGAGDKLLREVALTLAGAVREDNVVARYGGDEFVVVLPNTSGEFARRLAFALRGLFTEQVTISVGVASLAARSGTKQELLAKADEALYLAKKLKTGVEASL